LSLTRGGGIDHSVLRCHLHFPPAEPEARCPHLFLLSSCETDIVVLYVADGKEVSVSGGLRQMTVGLADVEIEADSDLAPLVPPLDDLMCELHMSACVFLSFVSIKAGQWAD